MSDSRVLKNLRHESHPQAVGKLEVSPALQQQIEGMVRARLEIALKAETAKQKEVLKRDMDLKLQMAMADLELSLVKLVLDVAARVCRRDMAQQSETAASWVKEGLARLGGGVVRVHPQDVAAAQKAAGAEVRVESDSVMEPGDVVIDQGAATFDATVNTRLEEAGRALRRQAGEKEPD